MKESELEDCYDLDFYAPMVQTRYGVNLKSTVFKARKKKWKDRMATAFTSSGQLWDSDVEQEVKGHVARLVEITPATALHTQPGSPRSRLLWLRWNRSLPRRSVERGPIPMRAPIGHAPFVDR